MMPLTLTPEAKIELDEAIEEGNLVKVEAFLKNGLDVNAFEDGHKDLLWWKCLRTSERTAKLLELFIKYGAKASQSCEDGYNALHAMIDINGPGNAEEEEQIARLLVENGAQLEELYQFYNWTPLMHAVMQGSLSEVSALLKAGADANKHYPENTIPVFARGLTLIMAAGARLSLVQLLLQYGADPELTNKKGENAITYFQRMIEEAETEFSQQDLRAKVQADLIMKANIRREVYNDFAKKFGEEMAAQLEKVSEASSQQKTVVQVEMEMIQAHETYIQDLKDCIIFLQTI